MEKEKNNSEDRLANLGSYGSEPAPRKQIRLSDLIHGVRRHKRLIMGCAIVGLALGIVLSVVSYLRGEMSKQYAVKTTIGITTQNSKGLFLSGTTDPNIDDVNLANDLVASVLYVAKSDKMLNRVLEKADLLGISTRDIYDNLTVVQYNDTQIIDVTLYWRSAQEGVAILEAFNSVAPNVLVDTLKIGGVTIINEPKARYLIGGNLNAALWGYMMILGLVLGVGFSILDLLIRPTLLNPKDIERDFQIEILTEIPAKKKFFEKKKSPLALGEEDDQNADVLDELLSLAQIVKKRIQKMDHACIYVTSAAQNEGKTTVTAYLAAYLAELGVKVLLVDFDTKNPKIGGLFLDKVEYDHSINALYRGETTKEDAITSVTPKLDILPAVLERKSLTFDRALLDMVNNIKGDYDVVLMDTSPVGQAADTMSLNELADLCLLVIRFDGPGMDVIKEAIGRLDKTGIRIMGCVINGVVSITGKNTGDGNRYGRYEVVKKPKRLPEKSAQKLEWEKWEKEHDEQE